MMEKCNMLYTYDQHRYDMISIGLNHIDNIHTIIANDTANSFLGTERASFVYSNIQRHLLCCRRSCCLKQTQLDILMIEFLIY